MQKRKRIHALSADIQDWLDSGADLRVPGGALEVAREPAVAAKFRRVVEQAEKAAGKHRIAEKRVAEAIPTE